MAMIISVWGLGINTMCEFLECIRSVRIGTTNPYLLSADIQCHTLCPFSLRFSERLSDLLWAGIAQSV